MNTTYTANANSFLIDGEVCLIESKPFATMFQPNGVYYLKDDKRPYYIKESKIYSISHSTKPLDGVKLLPRDKFVKPKDVEALAEQKSKMIASNGRGKVADLRMHFRIGYRLGHNANPNEFSYDFVINAISLARSTNMMADEIIDGLRPLSLPSQLQINEQGEIVNVIWK